MFGEHHGRYVLIGQTPVPESDLFTWAEFVEQGPNRIVRQDDLISLIGPVFVSTVFLGLDHNWGGGEPLLFETMIFGGPLDGEICLRYPTWDRAESGHRRIRRMALRLRPWICLRILAADAAGQARHAWNDLRKSIRELR